MQEMSQNASQPIGRRRRTAIAGGGRPALETLALLSEDPETEVVCVWDPDRTALIFRLEDLGFTFANSQRPKLLDDFRQLGAIPGLDSVIDASSSLQIRRSLEQFLNRSTPIISNRAAQILWGIRLGKDVGLGQDLEGLKALLEEIDLLRHETELFEILLQIGLIMTRSIAAELYLYRPEEQEPVMVYAKTQPSASSSASVTSVEGSDGNSDGGILPLLSTVNFSLVQRVVGQKRPVLIPDQSEMSSAGSENASGKMVQEYPALAVPILQGGHLVGILDFFRNTPHDPFTQQDVESCARLAAATAKYVSKVINLQEMRELSLGETIRTEIKAVLNSELPLEDKLAKGVDKIHRILEGCHVHFYVKERSSEDLILQASTTQASHVCGMLRVRMGEGFVGEAAKTRQPVLLKGRVHSFPSGNSYALLYVPLISSGKLCGVLGIEHLPAAMMTHKILKLMEEIGEEFGRVIAGDLEHQRMSRKLLRLSLVQEEGFGLLSETEREPLAIKVAASTAMVMDAGVVILRTFESKGKRLLVASTHGLHRNEMDSKLMQFDGLLALKAFQNHQPQVLEDLKSVDQQLPSNFPYRCGISRSLEYEGKTLGTLSIYNKLAFESFGSKVFDSDDIEILEKFSYYVGKALINLQEAQARSNLITIDELTGLRNERYMMLRLPEEMRRAERYHRNLSLMIFEVKGDPKIQPAEGSSAEKEFIKKISDVLQDTFRNVDILVRIKGTQFAILMPDTGESVTGAAARVTRSLASLPLKIFIGHSTYPDEAKTDQELIEKASKLSEVIGEF